MTRGERNIQWIETYCRIPEGKFVGQPVRLCPFQKEIILGVYDGNEIDIDELVRRVIISFGRKNAKTTISAFLCLLHLCGPEARPNSQLYSAAQSRDQAAILFNLMAKIVRMSPDLAEYVGIRDTAKQLYCDELGTLYRALSAEASTAYGLSPVFVVHDELGQVKGPRSELYEALETAAAAQDQPLSIIISTQAPEDADLLSILIDNAEHDEDTRLFLYTAPEDMDPFCEEAIRLANPAYDHFMNKKEVMRQAKQAKQMPSQEASYRNLILNQRIAREAPFVSATVWKLNGAPTRDEDFYSDVVVALDLSSRLDLTAIAYTGLGADGCRSLRCEFFSPQDGIREKSKIDKVPYDLWSDQGYITLCPGKSVDYAMVAQRLINICEEYNVTEVKFDRWKMKELQAELKALGYEDLPLVEHGQGFKDMSPAIDFFEGELINSRIRHGNHPVLTWNAANAMIDMDAAGNRKFNKKRSTGRIDGIQASAMCVGGSAVFEHEDEPTFMMV